VSESAVVVPGDSKGVTVIKEKKRDKKDSVFGKLSTLPVPFLSLLIPLYPLDDRYAVRSISSMIPLSGLKMNPG
jgi:hypothetical protein